MSSAWVYRRRGRYYIGPYSDTPSLTIMGPSPYIACEANDVGRAVVHVLATAPAEQLSFDEARSAAEERLLELANTAGVKAWRTFERGARLVEVDELDNGEVVATPTFRVRGYREPTPERTWIRLRRPSTEELGQAVLDALERARA